MSWRLCRLGTFCILCRFGIFCRFCRFCRLCRLFSAILSTVQCSPSTTVQLEIKQQPSSTSPRFSFTSLFYFHHPPFYFQLPVLLLTYPRFTFTSPRFTFKSSRFTFNQLSNWRLTKASFQMCHHMTKIDCDRREDQNSRTTQDWPTPSLIQIVPKQLTHFSCQHVLQSHLVLSLNLQSYFLSFFGGGGWLLYMQKTVHVYCSNLPHKSMHWLKIHVCM